MDFPWRSATDGWHILLAELLLQRTRAETVVNIYMEIVANYPELGDLACMDDSVLESLLFPLGLPDRAVRIKRLAGDIVVAGGIPRFYRELIDLPGVGDYIATAWLSFSGTSRSVIIDSNVARWLARMTGRSYDGETRRKNWLRELADRLTPARIHRRYNYAVLDFTRQICKPVSPVCGQCPLAEDYCVTGGDKGNK